VWRGRGTAVVIFITMLPAAMIRLLTLL